MTRKLIALLAFITGLAALSGPATASYIHAASSCDASVSAKADGDQAGKQQQANSETVTGTRVKKRTAPEIRIPAPKSLRPPVLMGVDRARE